MSLCITRLLLASYFLARVPTMAPNLSTLHLPVALIQQPTPSRPLSNGAIQSILVTLWHSLICSPVMQSDQLPSNPPPPTVGQQAQIKGKNEFC